MEKTYHFISGMPRSGSTLLCNLLSQNPRFRATGTSPLPFFLNALSDVWNKSPEAKANYNDEDRRHMMFSVLENYHLPFEQEVIFDKSRAWPSHIENLTNILQRKPKILVTTRFMPAIIASCEKIWRKEIARHGYIPDGMHTLKERVNYWCDGTQMVGSSYNVLKDAVQRGHKDCMYHIDFYNLSVNPRQVLQGIHDFLEEPWFEYDFNNVEQVIHEKDEFHGFSPNALHTIRPKVELPPADFVDVLGQELCYSLAQSNFDFLN